MPQYRVTYHFLNYICIVNDAAVVTCKCCKNFILPKKYWPFSTGSRPLEYVGRFFCSTLLKNK